MLGDGPSPKRRKTGNPVSAEAIAQATAQANSTVHHFTGQRRSRWMQSNVARDPPNRERGDETTARDVDACIRQNAHLGNHTANPPQAVNRMEPRAHVSAHANLPVTLPSQAPERAATTTTAAQPGFPSPATSEDSGPPNTGSNPFTSSTMQDRERVATAGPSSFAGHAHVIAAAADSATPRTAYSHRPSRASSQVLRSLSPPNVSSGQLAGLVSYSTPNWNANTSTHAISPRQALQDAPQQSAIPIHDKILSWPAMIERFKDFYTGSTAALRLNAIDIARIELLRDALQRGDMFFIVLSQIHALQTTPELIAESARKLDRQCFTYLDRLLSGVEQVSEPVRGWLSMFPAPVLSIYFSPSAGKFYESHVIAVVRFVSLLPQTWESFESECRARNSPPLVQEMAGILQLPSPVLQTMVFRAIARRFIDPQATAGGFMSYKAFASTEEGIQILEQLHRMDQVTFRQGYRRYQAEIVKAHWAFANAIASWRGYEEGAAQAYERDAPHFPNEGTPPQPTFAVPPDILRVFQPLQPTEVEQTRQHNTMPVQSPTQQQQASAFHARHFLSRSPHHPPGNFTQMPRVQDRAQHELFQQQAHQRAAAQGRISGAPPQRLQHYGLTPLFPGHNDVPRAQPTNPDPTRMALHQAHLRSPKSVPSAPASSNTDNSRLYRHVKRFALYPAKLDKNVPIQSATFNVSEESFHRIPKYVPSQTLGEPPIRSLTEASETYRLRCAAYSFHCFPDDASWVAAENYWPENLYIEFNGEMLEPRRKLHYNRYLPVDLTSKIRLGDNQIAAIINRASDDQRPFEYVLVVETVAVTSHATIRKGITTVSAHDSLASMKKSLSKAHDDDDIAITSSSLTIQLFDPHSRSKIFDIPVRGTACAHKDCFDLETFLGLCKRETPDGPTVVDCWRCPLCRGDVRPQTLIVDGFLVDVRKQLEKKGLLDTRAITVEADGSWQPKKEELRGVRSPSLERDERGDSAASGTGKTLTTAIELDV